MTLLELFTENQSTFEKLDTVILKSDFNESVDAYDRISDLHLRERALSGARIVPRERVVSLFGGKEIWTDILRNLGGFGVIDFRVESVAAFGSDLCVGFVPNELNLIVRLENNIEKNLFYGTL